MAAKNTHPPSLTTIHKRSLDRILHYLALQQIHNSKKSSAQTTSSQERHPHFLFQYHKNFQLVSRLKGPALALLKTQYAKKPKNPV